MPTRDAVERQLRHLERTHDGSGGPSCACGRSTQADALANMLATADALANEEHAPLSPAELPAPVCQWCGGALPAVNVRWLQCMAGL